MDNDVPPTLGDVFRLKTLSATNSYIDNVVNQDPLTFYLALSFALERNGIRNTCDIKEEHLFVYGDFVPGRFAHAWSQCGIEVPAVMYAEWEDKYTMMFAERDGVDLQTLVDTLARPALLEAVCSSVWMLRVQHHENDSPSRKKGNGLSVNYRDLAGKSPDQIEQFIYKVLNPTLKDKLNFLVQDIKELRGMLPF